MNNRRVVAIIQARYGSTRLPGKVLLDLAGRTVLAQVVARARAARLIDEVMVATTTLGEDDAVVAEAQRAGALVVRGSSEDVLARYRGAAQEAQAQAVVRLTADCPLLDPAVIDRVVDRFLGAAGDCDYASNTEPRTFPRGLDVEVFSVEALERAHRDANDGAEREHVTLHFHRHPDRFHLCFVRHIADLSRQRWTLDTAEDYRFLRELTTALPESGTGGCSFEEIASFVDSTPEIAAINSGVEQKIVF